MIRAAIVGIGRWGRTLVNSVHEKSTAIRFTTGCTRTPASAAAFCSEKGIELKNDLDAILADPAIDAVVLATPHGQHGVQAERAAAAGKHVFVEKPFTLEVKSAQAVFAAAARSGVVIAVAYPRRFHPATIELKTRIEDGRLGILSHCAAAQSSSTGLFMTQEHWRAGPQEGPAGAMSATGVHSLDAMIYLFGRVDEVYCTNLRRVMPQLEDTTSVALGLANGMSASLFCSLITAVSHRFAVYGTKGCAELAGQDVVLRFTPVPSTPPVGQQVALEAEIIDYKGFNALTAELEGFAAAIEGKRPYPITGEEILHGVAVFEAIARSAELHRPVKVEHY